MTEAMFVEKIKKAGGRAFIVGGWVRDHFRAETPKDKDYVITGIDTDEFIAAFPGAEVMGKSFPVFRLRIDGEMSEIALARKERKVASGYRGFEIQADKTVCIEDDLFRRDTTINAMAIELNGGKLFDPYNGKKDIGEGIIRAVSAHFVEDPVRALRAARQAAVFDFKITSDTIVLMSQLKSELQNEPSERIFGEMEKALAAKKPSIFFHALKEANILKTVFPEIAALIGKTQPVEYHPEGDAFEHTMQVLDMVAISTTEIIARFAALTHDIGKGTTPKEMEPHHYDHEKRGITELQNWNRRMPLPKKWYQTAEFVIKEHMRAPRLTKWGKIVDLTEGIRHLPIDASGVLAIFESDHHGLPDYLRDYDDNIKLLSSVSGKDAPKELKGAAIGVWIREQQIKLLKKKYRAAVLE